MTFNIATAAALLLSGTVRGEQISLATSYPAPVGVYNQIVTTGDGAAQPIDTTLNMRAGDTLLSPASNPRGRVGVGLPAGRRPAAKLEVDGEIKLASSGAECTPAGEGAIRYERARKALEFCDGQRWRGAGGGGGWTPVWRSIPLRMDVFENLDLSRFVPEGTTVVHVTVVVDNDGGWRRRCHIYVDSLRAETCSISMMLTPRRHVFKARALAADHHEILDNGFVLITGYQ